MLVPALKTLFRRDLEKLVQELSLYKDENKIWVTEKSIANAAGNLCLHIVGNLNTYIGAVFGNTGYIRNRPLEFSQKDIPRQELIRMIGSAIHMVEDSLGSISEADLETTYPLLVLAEKTSTGYMLVHLAVHLGYHLGQVNYHRRLLDVP